MQVRRFAYLWIFSDISFLLPLDQATAVAAAITEIMSRLNEDDNLGAEEPFDDGNDYEDDDDEEREGYPFSYGMDSCHRRFVCELTLAANGGGGGLIAMGKLLNMEE